MYRKSITRTRYEDKVARALNQVAARRRRMMEAPGPEWTHHEYVLRFSVSPDGRTIAMQVGEKWRRTASPITLLSLLKRAVLGCARRVADSKRMNEEAA